MVANAVGVIEAIRTNQYDLRGFTRKVVNNSGSDPELKRILSLLSYQIPRIRATYGDSEIERFEDRSDIFKKITYQNS